jgi:hypothetical protein
MVICGTLFPGKPIKMGDLAILGGQGHWRRLVSRWSRNTQQLAWKLLDFDFLRFHGIFITHVGKAIESIIRKLTICMGGIKSSTYEWFIIALLKSSHGVRHDCYDMV